MRELLFAVGRYYINSEEVDRESLKYFSNQDAAEQYYLEQLYREGFRLANNPVLAIFTIENNIIIRVNYLYHHSNEVHIGPVGPYKDTLTTNY